MNRLVKSVYSLLVKMKRGGDGQVKLSSSSSPGKFILFASSSIVPSREVFVVQVFVNLLFN